MRKRILTNFIFILLVSALISGALAFNFIKDSYIKSKEEKLLSNINLIKGTLDEKGDDLEEKDFFRLAQDLSSQIGSRVTFIKSDGYVIADSIDNSIIFQHIRANPEYRNAIKGDIQIIQRYSTEVGNKFFYLAMPPITLGDLEIIIRLGEDYQEIDHIIERFLMYTVVANFIGLLFAIVIGYMSVGMIVKPIRELTEASKLIAEGNFNNIVKVSTEDEVKELAISFNRMVKRLRYTIDEIKDKNAKLDAILASMQEGLIALDSEKRVILLNNSARKILDISNHVEFGEYIGNIIPHTDIIREIEMEIGKEYKINKEVELEDVDKKIIDLSISMIKDINGEERGIGTLVIIRDITSIRKLEQMRREFVANVSHEIRTPLTSIGGFIETLKIRDLDENSRHKIINIIEFETERLKKLINDLLALSEIENIKNIKQISSINIENDLHKIVELLKPQCEKKNINISVDIEDNLNNINGNIDWFRLIPINLIENSIKYTAEGGNIWIEVSNNNSGIILSVEDSGIGIPEEDISRIFERFYRVDKSRSSNIEGSGIGLAIVKHIVILFGGTIEVESQLGKGTRFNVLLP